MRARSADHHRRARDPGSAGASDRCQGRGRRDAPPVRRARLGLPVVPDAVGLPTRAAAAAIIIGVPPPVPPRVPAFPARARVAGRLQPAAAGGQGPRHRHRPRPQPPRARGRRTGAAAGRPGALRAPVRLGRPVALGASVPPVRTGRRREPAREPLRSRSCRSRSSVGAGGPAVAHRDAGRRPKAGKPAHWVMAAELVETSRLWARTVARIEPEWAESLAGDLVRRSYSEPRWDARRGAVLATEKVTLYGLPIVAARQVNYGTIDPAAARAEFIQHALVEGDWQTHHKFFPRNQRAREEAAELESKARRRGLVADDAVVFDFYDQRVPKTVTSARHFDSWWKRA